MSIQTSTGNVEVTPGDKIFVVNQVEFVLKIRNINGEFWLVLGSNHGSGWDEGVFAMPGPLPATGDAHAILTAALPAINKSIAAAAPGTAPAPSADLPHAVDALIQTLQVVNGQISF